MTLKPPSGSNTALIQTDGVVSLADHGVHGDGVTSDQAAWDAAVAATPVGGTLYIPIGDFYIPTPVCTKAINVLGAGIASAIHVNAGTGADGFVYGTTSRINGVTLRDFSVIGGANAARYALVIQNVSRSKIERVYVKAGCTYAVSLEGVQISELDFVIPGNNVTFPYTSTAPTGGIRVVGSSLDPSNANHIHVVAEAMTGKGVFQDASVGTAGAFNNHYTGTVEGLTDDAVHIKGNNSTFDWSVNVHMEIPGGGSSSTNSGLRIESCQNGKVFSRCEQITVTGSRAVEIEGYCYGLSIDSTSSYCEVGNLRYGAGGIVDSGANTIYRGKLENTSSVNIAQAGAGAADTGNLLRSDGLRAWDTTPKPVGSTIVAGTITKTGDGQGDTRRLFVPFAGLMAGAAAIYHEAVSAADLEEIKGRYVTLSAWVYIPSGQANQPTVVVETNITSGSTFTGQSTAVTDTWTQVSITSPIPTGAAGVNLRLRNTNASTGNWYIAGTSSVVGRVAPRTRPTRVRSRRYAELTWDPASIADGAVANQNVTVQGAALGDQAVASFSLGTGNGVMISARVIAADTVQVTVFNKSGGALDLASGTLRVETWSY